MDSSPQSINPEISAQRTLIPDSFFKPATLFWTCMLPQIFLLALNLHSFWLIYEQIVKNQMLHKVQCIISFESFILILIGLFALLFHKNKYHLNHSIFITVIVLHIGYLWMICQWADSLLRGVQTWIFNPGEFFLHQFSLMMPGLFHAGFCLACFPTQKPVSRDVARSGIMMIGIPAILYFFATHTRNLRIGNSDIILILVVLSTLICLMAFIRCITMLWIWVSSKNHPSSWELPPSSPW